MHYLVRHDLSERHERLITRLVLLAAMLVVAACAERPHVGVTISNSPPPIGACAPPKPGAGC
jgi:uncharacterized lipoprotein YajG